MSELLRTVRSFDQNWRHIRPSENGDMPSERPIALLREFHALESEANSNPFGDQLRAGALLKKRTPWQIRATALITLLGPPAASLVLFAVYYFEYWRTVPFNSADFLVVFFLFAIPVGYAFGAVPALLAASLYCALLTAHSRLMRPLIRACMAAICGGLVSWVWFCELLSASGIYGLLGALVMAALSVSSLGRKEPHMTTTPHETAMNFATATETPSPTASTSTATASGTSHSEATNICASEHTWPASKLKRLSSP